MKTIRQLHDEEQLEACHIRHAAKFFELLNDLQAIRRYENLSYLVIGLGSGFGLGVLFVIWAR